MAWSQSDIDTLKAAIASGARKVKYGYGPDAQEVEYRSLDEMRQVLADMLAEVNPASAPARLTFTEFRRD